MDKLEFLNECIEVTRKEMRDRTRIPPHNSLEMMQTAMWLEDRMGRLTAYEHVRAVLCLPAKEEPNGQK